MEILNLFLSKTTIGTICAIIAIPLAKVFIHTIKTLPSTMYQSWAKKYLNILQENLDIKNLTLNSEIIHKKSFVFLVIVLYIACAITSNSFPQLLMYLVFCSVTLILIVIDYKTMLLPNELTIPLIWFGLLSNLHGIIAGSLENSVYGAVAGYLSLWLVFWGFKIITKKEGMGYGDFKFLAAILAFLGVQYLTFMLLLSSLLGILYFIVMTMWNKTHKTQIGFKQDNSIAFGPYLGLSGIILLFFGSNLSIMLSNI